MNSWKKKPKQKIRKYEKVKKKKKETKVVQQSNEKILERAKTTNTALYMIWMKKNNQKLGLLISFWGGNTVLMEEYRLQTPTGGSMSQTRWPNKS